jgi:hypothetical protein
VAWREDKIVRAFRGRFRGVPTFIRALFADARQGGENGYLEAALTFARSIGSLIPDEVDLEPWQVELDWLAEMVDLRRGLACIPQEANIAVLALGRREFGLEAGQHGGCRID